MPIAKCTPRAPYLCLSVLSVIVDVMHTHDARVVGISSTTNTACCVLSAVVMHRQTNKQNVFLMSILPSRIYYAHPSRLVRVKARRFVRKVPLQVGVGVVALYKIHPVSGRCLLGKNPSVLPVLLAVRQESGPFWGVARSIVGLYFFYYIPGTAVL